MSFLEKLRKKPDHIRTRYALGGAITTTLLIALVWSTTLPAQFAELEDTIKSDDLVDQTASVQEGFDSLLEGLDVLDEELPPPEVETEAVSDSGAMGNLGEWQGDIDTLSLPDTYKDFSPEEELVPDTAGVSTSTKEETPVTPKVILIGTTTKKAE